MPKKNLEINKFLQGIISTPSSTDVNFNAAKYSKNIDSSTAKGRLQGIDGDKKLTTTGFKDEQSTVTTAVSVDALDMVTIQDKVSLDKTHLVTLKIGSDTSSINLIEDIYSNFIEGSIELQSPINFETDSFSMLSHDGKAFIGLGGKTNTTSKVVMKIKSEGFANNDTNTVGIFDAELSPANMEAFSGLFSEFMQFPIHGNTPSGTAISYNDTLSGQNYTAAFYADYDKTLNNSSDITGETLYVALQTGGLLAGLEVGQVFKVSHGGGSNDFSDNALEAWKRYDYDSEQSVGYPVANDLFMFCGYMASTDIATNVPILRFIGNASADANSGGGTPAFAYAYKENSSKLYKISLTKTHDNDGSGTAAFDGATTGSAVSGNTGSYTPSNTGSRVTEIDLNDMDSFAGNYITAISGCHSPLLYNQLNLRGANNPQPGAKDTSDIYYNNGHMKILYRHGVFYVASRNEKTILYRVNAIDFHRLTDEKITVDSSTLDFSKIPDQLHAEDNKGIVRQTMEDLLTPDGPHDPKTHNETWNRIPEDVYILGICETFENGPLHFSNAIGTVDSSTWSGKYAYKITTEQRSRLTTGDKVRFAGLDGKASGDGGTTTGHDKYPAFNTKTPYEISVVDDGDAFFIDSGGTGYAPGVKSAHWTSGGMHWWNAKVWILYGRKSSIGSFADWDMFLYNANTIDMQPNRTLYMADRTPPYHQARYYETLIKTANSFGAGEHRMYYPGQFSFALSDPRTEGTHGVQITNENTTIPGATIGDTSGNNNTQQSPHPSYGNCKGLLGIYDKSGRWSINGGEPDTYFHPAGTTLSGFWRFQGGLYWGDNIGWDVDEGRKISPIRNSLHPSVPYSTLYMGCNVYHGYNRDAWHDDNAVVGSLAEPSNMKDADDLKSNFNRPKHAVTFLGRLEGKFVAKPGLIWRADHWYVASNEVAPNMFGSAYDLPFGYTDNDSTFPYRNCRILNWYTQFRLKGSWLDHEQIDIYNNDETLFTLDDFSGHRGSVKYADVNAINSAHLNSGINEARPNWGGPEIENPLFKADEDYSSGSLGRRLYGSTNGGFYSAKGATGDTGWEGYAPPRLFTPGSGYYVYINRTWRNSQVDASSRWSNDNVSATNDNNVMYFSNDGNEVATQEWAFQLVGGAGMDPNLAPSKVGWDSNRWHNFSSTAISDNQHNMLDDSGLEHYSWLGHAAQSRFIRRAYPINPSSEYSTTFGGQPYRAGAVCTFHKLNLPSLSNINSIIPTIVDTEIRTDSNAGADFVAGYLIGFDTTSNQKRVAFLRTNLDPVFDAIVWDSGNLPVWNTDNFSVNTINSDQKLSTYNFDNPLEVRNYKQEKNRIADSSNSPWLVSDASGQKLNHIQPSTSRNTGPLEVMPIGSTTPVRYPSDGGEDMYLKQLLIDENSSTVVGDIVKPIPQIPWATVIGGHQDWIVYSNSASKTATYIGDEENKFDFNGDADYYTTYPGTKYGDISGSFAVTTWSNATDDNIISTFSQFISFDPSTEGTGGALSAGKYYYKFALEYDDRYESPLNNTSPASETLTAASSESGGTWEYIRLTISVSMDVLENLSPRTTGLVVYRKFEGGDADAYSLVKVIKWKDSWSLIAGHQKITITDDGNLGWDYSIGNGISQTIENTSLNYGLSTKHQGHLFVSNAWHPEMDASKHYIFKSLPNNFYAFNWIEDYLIMPEQPIAMTNFNSKLYVWGKNSLYKIDHNNLVIEDEYEGISIASRHSFAKTEYGLCFLDHNNVYLHDGNQPKQIANDILYATSESILYDGSSYSRLKQGYRELIEDTIAAGYHPRVFYSALKNSFVILLYSTSGLALAYNIDLQRWDLWDAPTPKGALSVRRGDILISDGTSLYQYLENTSAADYSSYRQEEWDWISNDINFGLDNQEKVFKTLSFTGSPCIYDFKNSSVALYDSSSDTKTLSVQVFVDDKPIALTVKNKFYDTMRYAGMKLADSITAGQDLTIVSMTIQSDISVGVEFLRPGQLIKINNEIMLITSNTVTSTLAIILAKRALMGTTASAHSTNDRIDIVAPKLSFPGGTKGNRLKLQLEKQHGYIDSISVSYKPKTIK